MSSSCACRPLIAAVFYTDLVPQVRAWVQRQQLPRGFEVMQPLAIVWPAQRVRLEFAYEVVHCAHLHRLRRRRRFVVICLNLSRFFLSSSEGVPAPLAWAFGLQARYPLLLERLQHAFSATATYCEYLFFSRRHRRTHHHHYVHRCAAPRRGESLRQRLERAEEEEEPSLLSDEDTRPHHRQEEEDGYVCSFYDDGNSPS
jgi:hypothetical protein